MINDELKNLLISCISNKEINVREELFYKIKQDFSRDDILDTLANVIVENVNFPYKKYTYQELMDDFNSLSRHDNVTIHYKKYAVRGDYHYHLNDIYISGKNNGNIASNYFQQKNRFNAGHVSFDSPTEIWTNVKRVRSILRYFLNFDIKEVNSKELLQSIHLNSYVNSQFKPCIAKFIYDKFNAKSVLDLSSGWGDRLCGFYASSAKSYFGIDPNTSVYKDYYNQIEFYERFVHKDVHIENLPAEDVDLKDYTFDVVFTSPPYFNTEKYCNEETQSWKRYSNLDSWLNDFLFKILNKSCEHLKDNGYLIINISDIVSNNIQICDKMNDYIGSLDTMKYLGCFGMNMSKRPGSNMLSETQKDLVFCEPVWVWQKSDNPTSLNNIFKDEIEEW